MADTLSDQAPPEEPGSLLEQLTAAGWDPGPPIQAPSVGIQVDESGRPLPLGDHVALILGGDTQPLMVSLPPVRSCFRGQRQPPDMKRPPDEFLFFFHAIERTAHAYCAATGSAEVDQEFHRLYRVLRDRPDGRDRNPLFAYMRAAATVYLALRETSEHEYRAVLDRLARSAKTFSSGMVSRNYWETVLVPLGQAAG